MHRKQGNGYGDPPELISSVIVVDDSAAVDPSLPAVSVEEPSP